MQKTGRTPKIDAYSVLVTNDGLATTFTEVRPRRQRMSVETLPKGFV
jgi:hypothetical protein